MASASPLTLPGFCDLQVNGFAGVDFNTPGFTAESVSTVEAGLRRTGVTLFLPTLITSSLDRFSACARVLARAPTPAIPGLHMEGPYISPEACGAHPPEHVRPASVEDFQQRQEAADGRIVLVTLAPEVPGALGLIEYLVARGIRVAIGHTAATPQAIRDAVAAGATLCTHLGNGSPAHLPRHENHLWEQLGSDDLVATFIADGCHLTPAELKSMIRAKTPARSVLVSDATAPAGMPAGRYRLGTLEVLLSGDGAVRSAVSGKLAGSALTLDVALANTMRFCGVPLAEAAAMASTTPAGCLGLAPRGRIVARFEAGRLSVESVTD